MTNKIKCLACNTILESKSRHDFNQCDCPNGAFVDGGNDYHRGGALNLSKIAVWNDKTKRWGKLKLK